MSDTVVWDTYKTKISVLILELRTLKMKGKITKDFPKQFIDNLEHFKSLSDRQVKTVCAIHCEYYTGKYIEDIEEAEEYLKSITIVPSKKKLDVDTDAE